MLHRRDSRLSPSCHPRCLCSSIHRLRSTFLDKAWDHFKYIRIRLIHTAAASWSAPCFPWTSSSRSKVPVKAFNPADDSIDAKSSVRVGYGARVTLGNETECAAPDSIHHRVGVRLEGALNIAQPNSARIADRGKRHHRAAARTIRPSSQSWPGKLSLTLQGAEQAKVCRITHSLILEPPLMADAFAGPSYVTRITVIGLWGTAVPASPAFSFRGERSSYHQSPLGCRRYR